MRKLTIVPVLFLLAMLWPGEARAQVRVTLQYGYGYYQYPTYYYQAPRYYGQYQYQYNLYQTYPQPAYYYQPPARYHVPYAYHRDYGHDHYGHR